MREEMPNGNCLTEIWELGDVCAHIVIQRQLAALDQQHHRKCRELL